MNKRIFVMAITLILLVAAGICYSIRFIGAGANGSSITNLEVPKDSSEQLDTARNTGLEGLDLSKGVETPVKDQKAKGKETDVAESSAEDTSESPDIYVHLCGAVQRPSVYLVKAGARLVEVIQSAGGLTEDAAGDYVNQAMVVKDGLRIYIPTLEEIVGLSPSEFVTESEDLMHEEEPRLININRADAIALMALPGIGQAKADSILAYRRANGNFQNIEALMEVPGIKEGLFSQIASMITVNE